MTLDLARWTTRPYPARLAIEGLYTRLEPFDVARHADDLFAASMAPGAVERHRYLFEEPMDRTAFDRWFAEKAQQNDPLFFAVIDKATGKAEGRQALMRIDPTHGVIEIGSILWGPAISRSRIATEALYLFMLHAFEGLGYRRFEWKCHNENAPSKKAAVRFGFTYEGTFRQHMVAKGRNRDTAWFSIVDSEWPILQAGYKEWLNPANFDANGIQKRTLAASLDAERGRELPARMKATGFRRAGARDFDRLVALQQQAYASNARILGVTPIPLQWDYHAVLRDWECFVLDGEGRLEAAMIGVPRADDYFIESLSVCPDRQGAGLGRLVLDAGEARARQLSRSKVRFITGLKLSRNVDWYCASGYAIERIERRADREIAHFIKNIREE
ncbi:MAG TPA: GNAT family N-acetyltransferase [Rhabdaerophilum sp.]|nr:GNAT family N-acetyltransferase [Rhabdaerophilum sp.]